MLAVAGYVLVEAVSRIGSAPEVASGAMLGLHLWTLTSGMNVASAHLVAASDADGYEVLEAARDMLRDRHGVAHATLQVESRTETKCQVDW